MAETYRKGGTYTTDPRTGLKSYQAPGAKGTGYASSAEVAAQKTAETDWSDFAKSLGISPMTFSGLGGGAARSRYKAQFDAWRGKKSKSLSDIMAQGQ